MPGMSRRSLPHTSRIKNRREPLSARNGFTLVETLVVITILSVCAAGIIATFFSGIKLWDRATNENYTRTEFFIGIEQLTRDFRQSVNVPVIGFKGTAQEISFPAIEREALVMITYLYDPQQGALMRRVTGLKDALSTEEKQQPYTEKKVLPAEGVSFSYFVYDKVKEKGDWKDAWNKEDGVFAGILLRGRYRGEEFSRKIFIPAS